jgi:hypothetical protein
MKGEEMNTLVMSTSQWKAIADTLEKGNVQFSTGSQQRGAQALAEWIHDKVEIFDLSDDVGISLTLDWDETLSVHQAAAASREMPKSLSTAVSCSRCGRLLTDPKSVERGIGPDCLKMELAEAQMTLPMMEGI